MAIIPVSPASRRALTGACLLAALAAPMSFAQTQTASALPVDPNIQELLNLPLFDMQEADRIKEIRSDAERRTKDLEKSQEDAKSALQQAKARTARQKTTIENNKADRKLAKQQYNPVQQATLEAEGKRAEAGLKLLKQHERILSTRIDAIGAEHEWFKSSIDALDIELETQRKIQELADMAGQIAPDSAGRRESLQAEITALERSLLDAIKRRVQSGKKMIDKMHTLTKERLKFTDMRASFLHGQ